MSGEAATTTAGGRVTEVRFTEGQIVKSGDLLLRLDSRRIQNEIARRREMWVADEAEQARLEGLREAQEVERLSRRQRAEADVALARAERARTAEKPRRLSEVHAATAARTGSQIAILEQQRERTKTWRDRMAPLVKERIISAAEFDDADSDWREAEERVREAVLGRERDARQAEQDQAQAAAELREAEARLARAEAEREAALRGEEPARQELEIRLADVRGRIQAAREEHKSLALDLEQCEVRAQVGGIVTRGEIRVGDVLEPGKAVVAIAPQVPFRISAAVPASEIAGVRPGMKVRVKLDAYDWQKYGTVTGTVSYVAPDVEEAEQADGSSFPHYHVKVALDRQEVGSGDAVGKILLGMTGQVEIVRGSDTVLDRLLRRARNRIEIR